MPLGKDCTGAALSILLIFLSLLKTFAFQHVAFPAAEGSAADAAALAGWWLFVLELRSNSLVLMEPDGFLGKTQPKVMQSPGPGSQHSDHPATTLVGNGWT